MRRIRVSEAAKIIGVSPQALRNWDNNGILPAAGTFESSRQRYYYEEQLREFVERNGTDGGVLRDILHDQGFWAAHRESPLASFLKDFNPEEVPLWFVCKVTTTPVAKQETREYFFAKPLREGGERRREAVLAFVAAASCLAGVKGFRYMKTASSWLPDGGIGADYGCGEKIFSEAVSFANGWLGSCARQNASIEGLKTFLAGNAGSDAAGDFLILEGSKISLNRYGYNYRYGTRVEFFAGVPLF